MAGLVVNSTAVLRLNIRAKLKVSASITATSPSCETVVSMKNYTSIMAFVCLFIVQGCSFLQNLSTMKQVQFRIGSITSVSIGGVNVMGKQKVTDFSVGETISLAGKVAGKTLPLSLTVNLEARNPNESVQGNGISMNGIATLRSLEWRLLIDDVPTISGIVQGPITFPAGGETVMIPITTEFNLFSVFEERGYAGMAKLAFALANPGASKVSVKVDAKPMIETFMGNMTYPGRIIIIEKEFN
ncbi:MAG: hypothetical protein ACKO5I_05915 [Ignavibacteria bacterium]